MHEVRSWSCATEGISGDSPKREGGVGGVVGGRKIETIRPSRREYVNLFCRTKHSLPRD